MELRHVSYFLAAAEESDFTRAAARLGFTGSAAFHALVPTAIRAFARAYPDVSLTVGEAKSARLLVKLGSRELDAAFLRPKDETCENLRLRELDEEPMLLCLPSRHPLAERRRLSLAELVSESFILCPRVVGPRLHDVITGACRAAGFEPTLGQQVPQILSIINLAAAEVGIPVVPRSLSQIPVDGVVYVPIEGVTSTAPLRLAWQRDARATTLANILALVRQPAVVTIGFRQGRRLDEVTEREAWEWTWPKSQGPPSGGKTCLPSVSAFGMSDRRGAG